MIDLAAQIDTIAAVALDAGISLRQAIDLIDARFVAVAMKRSNGNVTHAARILGIHRNSVHGRLRATKKG